MTVEGDVVLVYIEEDPAFFARIESITPDEKPHWFQVKMLILQIPLVIITWILRRPYINGEEFTIGGKPIRMIKVVAPDREREELSAESPVTLVEKQEKKKSASKKTKQEKVVSLLDRRKKNERS